MPQMSVSRDEGTSRRKQQTKKKDKKINAENQCVQTQGHSSGFCLIWILYILKYKCPYFFMNHM